MKKSTIWTIAVVMGLAFAGLLLLQLSYIEEMAKMKKEQFDESVNHALDQAAHNLEMNETLRYLGRSGKLTSRTLCSSMVLTEQSSSRISLP